MRVFITGATGFIGSHLTEHLLRTTKDTLRLLYRKDPIPPPLQRLIDDYGERIELLKGDLGEPESFRLGLKGCSVVYHLAAVVRLKGASPQELEQTNVEATSQLLHQAKAAGVSRFFFLSSIGAIRRSSSSPEICHEETPYAWKKVMNYQYTKHLAEKKVIEADSTEMKTFLANPSVVVGEGITNPSLITLLSMGPLFPGAAGGTGIVHVKDVIRGIELIMDKGKSGRRYILGGENIPYRKLFEILSRLKGVDMKIFPLPKFLGKHLPGIKKLFTCAYYSSKRAEMETGWYPEYDTETALKETLKDLKKRGYIK